jgi:peptide/nickel transport system substrate-binding protein
MFAALLDFEGKYRYNDYNTDGICISQLGGKMKKFISLIAIALLAASMAACGPTASGPSGTLIVGTPKMNGDFIAGFGNSAYDNAIRTMIWDYPTYTTTPAGEFVLNETVVEKQVTSVDDAGNKTYTFTIKKGLKWSDGSAVTAKDFVFGILFAAHPAWTAAGASSSVGDSLVGYAAYKKGDVATFTGVKLVDDNNFAVTIAAEELPYFYEVSYAAFGPTPMASWAPDLTFNADGNGLVGDVAAVAQKIATTERFKPTVVSGPFTFESFENDVVTLKNNPNFAGDYRGVKAKLETVIVKYVDQNTDVDLVISGDIDLVSGVVQGNKIEKAKAATTADVTSYLRNGYGLIAYHTDFGPTKFVEVRQALAFLIDRNIFLTEILGGYGAMTNGEYGLAQWMYQTQKEKVAEKLINYTYNVQKANELLDASPYKFEADGVTPFDPAKAVEGYWRHTLKAKFCKSTT